MRITRLEIWKDNGTGVYLVSPDEGIVIEMPVTGQEDALTECRTYRDAWSPEDTPEAVHPAGMVTDEPQSRHLATYRPERDELELHGVDEGSVVAHLRQYLGLAAGTVGERVMAGTVPGDYDVGTILEVEGDDVLVGWDWSGVRTRVSPADLLAYDEARAERWSAELADAAEAEA